MSVALRRAFALYRSQPRRLGGAVCFHLNKTYCHYAREPYKLKPFSYSGQSHLLPGKDRIRCSKLSDKPDELISDIPGAPHIQTVYDVLDFGLKVSGDGDCIGTRPSNNEEYKWLRYSEVISKAQYIGSGLLEVGMQPRNDSFVGVFAANREEFLLTLYACSAYSMVLVPLYISLGLQSVLFIINQANLPLVIVNSSENALKVLHNAKQLPSLQTLVLMDSITPPVSEAAKQSKLRLLQYSELEALGKSHKKSLVLPKADDLFCIPYTSGTTGTPKGVMLTHRNMITCVSSLVIGYGEAGIFGGTILSYLPPAHIYEIANEVASLFFARRIAFYSGDIKMLMEEVKRLKPTILPLVPRLMNAIYMGVIEKVKGNAIKSKIFDIALARKEKLLRRGKVTSQSVWDKLVFKKLQEALGGEAHMIITTSAPISAEISHFFRCASGAHVFEAYGQTEMLAAVMTLPMDYNGGYVGAPLPCNYVKLVDVPEMGYYSKDDIGEVCIKGPNVFKGYFKNEKDTNESLIDGWQHTGDIGQWLPNGTLKIVDRKKHLFKLSQGEYIAPEKVENIYTHSKLVLQIFVDGLSDKDYIIALIVPELNGLKKWLKSKGYKDTENIVELLKDKEIRKKFLCELRQIGTEKDLIPLEQARNMTFILEPFSVDNELLTPTLKVRRNEARKHFHETIVQLYEEGPLF